MPRVPTYDGPQVRQGQLQPVYQGNLDVSSGGRALAQALNSVSDEAARKVERDAQTEAWNAQAAINESFVQWNAEARKNAQGANAKGYTDSVTAWWDKAKQDQFSKLSPMAQQLAAKSLSAARVASLESASGYENQQLDIGERSALQANVSALTNQAVAAGPDKAAPVLDQAVSTIRAWGAKKGIDVEPEVMRATTGAHVTIINQLMQTDPKRAEAYFNANKSQINSDQWDNIGEKINHVSAVTDGEAKATELWNATVKPGDYKNPVDQFALEKQMREAFPNDPTRQKAGIQALREMSAAWNKSQAEAAADGTNKVFKMLDSGVSLTRVMRSDVWQQLPGQQQHAIQLQIEQQAAAREQRAAAAESREFTREQREDKRKLLTNADQFLHYTDPEVLHKMTRPQVEALRATFGFEGAQHLLSKFDALQKPGAIGEARMDTEDFNHAADQLGLDPYNAKTPEKKQALGELKYRVEQLIDLAQQQKGKALTRDEKGELMRSEMARTVTVNPGWWRPNTTAPVIQLKPDDLRKVVVPQADKEQISQALRTMYARDPKNPLYAPTDDNVRRLYLANRSRASALIPEPKQ